MMVFWWSGRGYLTMLIVLGVLALFGILLPLSRGQLADGAIYWGFAILAAAIANWLVGSSINRKKRAAARPKGMGQRLRYRTPHRFMSLPMETFSLPLALLGIVVALTGLGI